jgi:hypothetical protein
VCVVVKVLEKIWFGGEIKEKYWRAVEEVG